MHSADQRSDNFCQSSILCRSRTKSALPVACWPSEWERDNAWDPGPCRRSICAHWPGARRLQSRTRRRCSSATCVYCDGVIRIVAVIPEEAARARTRFMCAGGRIDATPGHLEIIVWIGTAIGDMEVIPRIAGVIPFWQALAACHSTDNSVLRYLGDSHLSPQNIRLVCSYPAHTPVLHDRRSQVDVSIGAAYIGLQNLKNAFGHSCTQTQEKKYRANKMHMSPLRHIHYYCRAH